MTQKRTILTLSGVRGDTRRYRSFHTYEQLRLAGVECELSHITDPALPDKVNRASVTIFHRVAYDPYIKKLLDLIREQKCLALLDTDDLIFYPPAFQWIDSPDFQDPVRASLYQEDMRRNEETLQACHAITASTDYLAEHTRSMDKPSWVHRNAFSMEMLKISNKAYHDKKQDYKRVVIGYASGTPTHDRDFEIAKPAIKWLLEKYPLAELWLIGPLNPGDGWESVSNRMKHHDWVPWRELPTLQAQFDINLAPLVIDNPFGQSKSEIKYVEAGLVRVPTIASSTNAFNFAIRPGETGFLAADDQEWIDALTLLVEDPETRVATGERAYQDVLSRYHPAVRASELVATLNQIHEKVYNTPLWELEPEVDRDRFKDNDTLDDWVTWINDVDERDPTLIQMARYSLRHRGPRTLFMNAWIYFRRLVATIIPYRKAD